MRQSDQSGFIAVSERNDHHPVSCFEAAERGDYRSWSHSGAPRTL